MKLALPLIIAIALATSAQAADDPQSKPPDKEALPGYVACSNRQTDRFVSMFLDLCQKVPAGRLDCGQTISVVQRRGEWVEIALPDKRPRYLPADSVSQSADKFVPLDANSAIPNKSAEACPPPPPPEQQHEKPPQLIYAPDPEYSLEAKKKNINGTVQISLIVGLDGVPHDISVHQKLGYGLDEKAMEVVRKWRFRPALKDGEPVEKQAYVEIMFHLYRSITIR
jgi:TonB family protein